MKQTRPNSPNTEEALTAKARGAGFFGLADTKPYAPRGVLLGQSNEYSCVPACARMLIVDHWPAALDDQNCSEAYLRTQFQTVRQGSVIARIPAVLQAHGVAKSYVYRRDLTVDDLRHALTHGAGIAVLRDSQNVHVVIVEQLTDEFVAIRDPLPPGCGSAYWVALEVFLSVWLKTGWGSAIVVDFAL